MENQELIQQPAGAGQLANQFQVDVGRVVAMRRAVVEIMNQVMVEGLHYGEIPGMLAKEGEKKKKVLWLAGADVMAQTFRLRPEYEMVTRREEADFISFEYRCRLYNIVTGELWGEGIASANSREDKYLNQCSQKVCPACKQPAIFKSKNPRPGEAWYCWDKKGGCGAKFGEDDKAILDQVGGINANKVWNLHHTLTMISCKRSFVKAVRTATGASDLFTQDLGDPDEGPGEDGPTPGKTTAVKTATKPETKPRANPIQVRDLNTALDALEIGLHESADLKGPEAAEAVRKAKAAWVNGILADHGLPPCTAAVELEPDVVISLIKSAQAGEMPKGGK